MPESKMMAVYQMGLFDKRPKDRRGGPRPGAGRPRSQTSGVPHTKRSAISRHHPVHVSVRLKRGLRRSLRSRRMYGVVKKALRRGCDRFGFRIVHYSVMGDHIHLICEAEDRRALSRGMQGFNLRISKGINKLRGKGGSVFRDRYHDVVLKTPRQVRNGLRYVLLNARRHASQIHDLEAHRRDFVDPYSSAPFFDGWKRECRRLVPAPPPPEDGRQLVAPAQSWLLTTGWKMHHPLIATWEAPQGKPNPNGSCPW